LFGNKIPISLNGPGHDAPQPQQPSEPRFSCLLRSLSAPHALTPPGPGFRVQCKNNCFTEMCSGSEEGSYLRLINFVYHSTLGVRVIKKKKQVQGSGFRVQDSGFRVQGSGFRVQGSGFRVQGSGFGVQGSGFRVECLLKFQQRLQCSRHPASEKKENYSNVVEDCHLRAKARIWPWLPYLCRIHSTSIELKNLKGEGGRRF